MRVVTMVGSRWTFAAGRRPIRSKYLGAAVEGLHAVDAPPFIEEFELEDGREAPLGACFMCKLGVNVVCVLVFGGVCVLKEGGAVLFDQRCR